MNEFKIIIGIICIAVIIIMIMLAICNRFLPRWFCDKMGWHLKPKKIERDQVNQKGICPRCGIHVMRDSQGNWFGSGKELNHHDKLYNGD